MSIGFRIRKARKARGFSQIDLARRINVSQPTVANWEAGAHDPRQLMLAKVADALGVERAWLSSGERSAYEQDKHPAAAYLRRPLVHVPVIKWEAAAKGLDSATFDPHAEAEDYIPVTGKTTHVFALFVTDPAINLAFPRDTLVVIDYSDRVPIDGRFLLAAPDDKPVLRRWREGPGRLEPFSSEPSHKAVRLSDPGRIIGQVFVSIRFHSFSIDDAPY